MNLVLADLTNLDFSHILKILSNFVNKKIGKLMLP